MAVWRRQSVQWQSEDASQCNGSLKWPINAMAVWRRQSMQWQSEVANQCNGSLKTPINAMAVWRRQSVQWQSEDASQCNGSLKTPINTMAVWGQIDWWYHVKRQLSTAFQTIFLSYSESSKATKTFLDFKVKGSNKHVLWESLFGIKKENYIKSLIKWEKDTWWWNISFYKKPFCWVKLLKTKLFWHQFHGKCNNVFAAILDSIDIDFWFPCSSCICLFSIVQINNNSHKNSNWEV